MKYVIISLNRSEKIVYNQVASIHFMFKNTGKDIANKLDKDGEPCAYLKDRKEFHIIIQGKEIPKDKLKQINKLDLEIINVRNNPDTLELVLKRRSQTQKWIIGTLSFTMIMVFLQFAYIASKTVFYLKP